MKLVVCGDVSIVDSADLFASGNADAAFNDVADVMRAADRTIVNLETAVTDKDTKIIKYGPNLKSPLGTGATLKKAGVTDCGLSNNHIFDYGKAGLYDTLSDLEKSGLNYTGIGENEADSRKNLVIEKDGLKIAVIAVCEHEYSYALPDRCGARPYDPYDTNDDIAEAKKIADFVVVTYHGGKEQCRYPSPRLLKACRSMVKHGADVVLCQHSHCVGCYEEFNGGHILYGQGNFHFIKKEFSVEDGWNDGLLVRLNFEKGKRAGIEFIPCVADGLGIRLANAAEKEEILGGFNARSETLKNGTWIDGWREFALSEKMKNYDVCVTEDAKEQVFAHRIDCEAHLDILKERFKTWNITNEKD